MKTKSFIVKMVNVLCIVAILVVYQNFARERQEKIAAMEAEVREQQIEAAKKASPYKDGTYTGTGQGYGGDVKVEMEISDGVITSAKVISADKETPEYLEQAQSILEKVVTYQSLAVDAVSGATLTSNGIINGLIEALDAAKQENQTGE